MQKSHTMSDMTAPRSRHFFYFTDIWFPLFLLAGITLIFRVTNLDMIIQAHFFRAENGWYLKNYPLFRFVYHFGNFPALALAIYGLVIFAGSFRNTSHVKWRKIGAFFVLTMLLAPGLLINAVLKDNWGRPRPRNVIEFQGKYQYEKLLTIDPQSQGNSFPCGHASMGFYLFIPWFVLRKKKPRIAALSLILGISAGLLIGLARIAQGGHFASDVIWSGLLVYLTGSVVFYVLRLHKATWYYSRHPEINSKQREIMTYLISLFIVIFVFGVVLATPYERQYRKATAYHGMAGITYRHTTLRFKQADVRIMPSDSLVIQTNINGFGFPGSKIFSAFNERLIHDQLYSLYEQNQRGFFSELDNLVSVGCPFGYAQKLDIKVSKGNVNIVIPDSLQALDLKVKIYHGDVDITIPKKFKPDIQMKGELKFHDLTGFKSGDGIRINREFRIYLLMGDGEVTIR